MHSLPRAYQITVAIVAATMTFSGVVHAGTCYLDDPLKNTPLTSPIQAGGVGDDFAGDDLCGHTVAGTSCVLEVNIDSEGTNLTDCLTLDEGVTVEMNDHVIDCPLGEEPCGSAIAATSGSTSSKKVTLQEGSVLGCWQEGILIVQTSAGAVVEDFFIDLTPLDEDDCFGATFGIQGNGGTKRITRTVVSGGTNCVTFVDLFEDGLIKDCGIGLNGDADTTIDNSVLVNSAINIQNGAVGTSDINFKNSTATGATTCNLRHGTTCDDPDGDDVIDLQGALNILGCSVKN